LTNQLLQKSIHILCLEFNFPVPLAFLEIYVAVVCTLQDCDAMYSVTQSWDWVMLTEGLLWIPCHHLSEGWIILRTVGNIYIIFCRLWCTNFVLCCGRPGGIPARNSRGERLLLFIGIIDILQSYRLKKKLEHTWKAMIHDGVSFSISVSPAFTWYWLPQNGKLKPKGQNCIYLHHMWKQGCVVVCVHVHKNLVGKLQDISVIFS